MQVKQSLVGLAVVGLAMAGLRASADEKKPVADPALIARLQQADLESALEDMRLKPWHMKLSFQLFDDKGVAGETGTIEEWWTSPQLHKIIYTSPSYTSTEIQNKDGFFRTVGAGNPPENIQALRREVVHPMPDAVEINETVPQMKPLKFGSVQLECIMLTQPIKNLAKSPMGLFPTYCMEPGKTSLRLSYSYGSLLLIRNTMGRFQAREVAIEQISKTNNVMASKAHVDVLESVAEQDSLFVPPPQLLQTNDRTIRAASGVIAGQLLSQVKPVYPQSAKENHVSGTVVLRAVIGKDGRVHTLRPLQSPDPDLAVAAIAAVRQWTYKPYILNGSAVEVETTITVNFNFGP